MQKEIALTVFQARAGDHNDLAIPGALSIGFALSQKLNLEPCLVGKPEPALNAAWDVELNAAMPALQAMAQRLQNVFDNAQMPLSATSRCTVSLATLPVVARHRPDACVVWFDAHADSNTPASSISGFMGGMVISGAVGLWDSGLGGNLDVVNVVLVGARDIDAAEQALIESGVICLVPPDENLTTNLRKAIAGRPVYVHLDCDVLNPGIVPTDYQVEDGLSLAELRAACTVIAESEIVGVEIAEFQNAWTSGGEPVSPTPLLDALSPLFRRMQGALSLRLMTKT
jgi:arginase